MRQSPLLLLLCACTLAHPALAQSPAPTPATPVNLFPEGSFETLTPEGNPVSWEIPHPSYQKQLGASFRVQVEPNGNRFVTLENVDSAKALHIAAIVPLPEGATRVRVRFKIRARGLFASPQPEWSSAQLGGNWIDASGADLGYLRGTQQRIKTDVPDWMEFEEVLTPPAGAARIRLQPGLYQTTGALDLDDIKVFAEVGAK